MAHVCLRWLKLPASGRIVGVDVSTHALAPDALQDERGECVRLSALVIADRAAVWAVYADERAAVDADVQARCV